MMSNDPGTDGYPMGPVSRWPAADIAAAWQRELPGVRTEAIEINTPVWRIAKVLADDRRRTLARLGVDPSTLDLLSVIRRSGPPYELTTREITRRTLITAGAVSQRVARAEQAGLVGRSPSSVSRRAGLGQADQRRPWPHRRHGAPAARARGRPGQLAHGRRANRPDRPARQTRACPHHLTAHGITRRHAQGLTPPPPGRTAPGPTLPNGFTDTDFIDKVQGWMVKSRPRRGSRWPRWRLVAA